MLRIKTSKGNRRETISSMVNVTDSTKYFGVTISGDLQWEKHTQATAAKASLTLGYQRRNLRDCSKQVHDTTYKSMVRPTMEYASTSWDLYKVEDVNSLDKVQHRDACYACNNYTEQNPGCITAVVSSLDLESLQDCRKIHSLTTLFKINRSSIIWSRSRSQNLSSRSTTAEHEVHIGFLSRTPMSQCIRYRSFQRPFRTGTNCHQQLRMFRRWRPSTALHASVAVQPPSTV